MRVMDITKKCRTYNAITHRSQGNLVIANLGRRSRGRGAGSTRPNQLNHVLENELIRYNTTNVNSLATKHVFT